MTAEQLRNSILQEAISGRLVSQAPNDEPASVLLQHIREEKTRLVKEGKLKKKDLVETPITDDEKPFEIPDSWEWVRIKDICSIVNGFTPRRTEPKFWTNGTINWFTVEDINKQGEVIRYTEQKITKAATSEDRIVRPGSVLLCCTASVGRCAITTVPVTTNQQFNALTVKEELRKAVSDTYILTIAKTLAPTLHQLAGQTTFEFVSVTKVGNIVIPLPPLAEQKRIVAKLEELLPIVEQYGKAQKELDELNAALPARLRQSILQEAISGRLVPQDPNDEPASVLLQRIREEKARLVKEGKLKKKDLVETPITDEEKPFEIPSSWEWVRYQDIADCALGKTKNPNQVEGELCQYLCSINVYWDSVRLNVLKEMLFSDTDKQKYSVEKGDMLICEGGEAGRSAIYEGNISPIYYQNALHRVRFYGGICTRFFLYQMELYKKTGLLTDHIKGETIQHFVSTKLLNLPIPLPPLAEQQRIVAKIEELFAEIDKLK